MRFSLSKSVTEIKLQYNYIVKNSISQSPQPHFKCPVSTCSYQLVATILYSTAIQSHHHRAYYWAVQECQMLNLWNILQVPMQASLDCLFRSPMKKSRRWELLREARVTSPDHKGLKPRSFINSKSFLQFLLHDPGF